MSVFNQEIVTREAQRSLFVENKAFAIANTTLKNIAAGEVDTVVKTILSYPQSQTYTPSTDLTQRVIVGTSESLSIGTWIASLVSIDDTEKIQSVVDLSKLVAKRMMANLNNDIEQRVLYEVMNAAHSLDDAAVGGTAGNNMALNTSNVPQVFIAADNKLDAIDAPKEGRTAVIGGHMLGLLKLQQAGRNTVFGDGVNTRGIVTNLFGWDILYSNNLYYTATLTMGTAPTESDTVTIAGVTFTFNATPSGAGSVDIGNAATSHANLVAAINDSGTVDTTYIQLSAENRFLLRDKRRIVATDGTGNFSIVGYGDIVVSETLSATADVWSAQTQNSLFCVKGFTDMIIQIPPKIEEVRAPLQFATWIKSLTGFGKKTFADGAREAVRVKIDASTSDWS